MTQSESLQPDGPRREAILGLVMVNLLWGISFPAMKATTLLLDRFVAPSAPGHPMATAVTQATSACFLISVRFGIALVILAVCVPALFRGLTWDKWRMGALTGVAFSAGFVFQIVGLNYVPASRSGFLTSLTVIFTPIAMTVIERKLPRWPVLAGVASALFGTAVLTGMCEFSPPFGIRIAAGAMSQIGPGDWCTIIAALIFTFQILLIDRFSRRMPAGQLTPGMFFATLGIGMLLFASGNLIKPPSRGTAVWGMLLVDWRFLALIAVMSVFCTVLAFHWMNKYQGHVTPAQAALIYTLEPIFATLWAMLLPGLISMTMDLDYPSERPGWELVIGGLLVVAGNAMALLPDKRPSIRTESVSEAST